MKNKLIQFPLYFFLLIFILISCDNGLDDVEPEIQDNYLVETKLVENYPLLFIKTFLQLATSQYPELEGVEDKFITGVDVYKIVYKTEFDGQEVEASGLVCLPTDAGEYPILSYQNGTNTQHSKAPSVDPGNELFTILEMMTSTGFIITLPDYLGFGESDDIFHPYLHKESTVQSVTDMLRAVEEFVDSKDGIGINNDLYLAGYSQGGWATMALKEKFDKQNDTNFNLMASACGAGPYNLVTINQYVTGLNEYPQPYFLGYIFNSYINLGLETGIGEVFQNPYADRIPGLYNGTLSGPQINAELTDVMPDLFTANYYTGWNSNESFEPVIDMLEENSIEAYNTKTPTMILHGTDDELVPPIVSSEIYDDFITLGVSPQLVTLVPLNGHSHTSGIIPSGIASMVWFINIRDGQATS